MTALLAVSSRKKFDDVNDRELRPALVVRLQSGAFAMAFIDELNEPFQNAVCIFEVVNFGGDGLPGMQGDQPAVSAQGERLPGVMINGTVQHRVEVREDAGYVAVKFGGETNFVRICQAGDDANDLQMLNQRLLGITFHLNTDLPY